MLERFMRTRVSILILNLRKKLNSETRRLI